MSLTIFRRVLPFIKRGWYSDWYDFSNFLMVGIMFGIKYKSNRLFKTEFKITTCLIYCNVITLRFRLIIVRRIL